MESKMKRNLTLSEGEQLEILVDDCEVAEAKKQGNNCLIGKIWAGKRINRDGFVRVFKRIWRIDGEVAFKEVQPNVWMFEFSQEEDKQHVLAGRPWSFDRFILALFEFDGSIPSSQWDFTTSPFWIQVHDMPPICMTKAIGTKIGESLGTLEEVDVEGEGVEWSSVLRIRVIIDLQKPLERGRALTIAGKAYWVSFQYENLPVFCFNCGRIVHENSGCPAQMNHEEEKQWGVWLRAGKLKRQGLGKGGRQPVIGTQTRNEIGGITKGGSNQTRMESHGFGGNPTPTHQARKESLAGNQKERTDWPKQAGGGNLACANGGNSVFTEAKHGKQIISKVNELERNELNGHVGEAITGKATNNMVDSKGAEAGEIMGELTEKEGAEPEWAEYIEATGEKSGYGGATKRASHGANWAVDTQGIKLGGNLHAATFGYPSGYGPNQGKNGKTEQGKYHDGKMGLQQGQSHNQNSNKIWKRVVRSEEDETGPASPTLTLLGKRKGDNEISTSDDEERHLKMRKWEDYLEEEVESENEMAEAAEQPRQNP
jgi:hypothetical protein